MSIFKVGDKVRYKDDVGPVVDFRVEEDDVGTVVSCFNDRILVSFGSAIFLREDEIELVTPADKKREFLQRLQSLLREFDAKINIGVNVDGVVGRCGVLFDVNNDRIFFPVVFTEMSDDPAVMAQRKFTNYPITADNIMDFDKE